MIAQVGFGFTTSVAVQVLVQPNTSVTVAVYVPALAACALLIVIVAPVAVNQLGPVQVKVNGGACPVAEAVKVAVAPAHTVCVAGRIEQEGPVLTRT